MAKEYTYEPDNIRALDEPCHQAFGTIATDATNGPFPALTPLMLDSTNNNLVIWTGTAGAAVALNICEAANSAADVGAPLYKSGAFKASALNWPDDITDAQKLVAFIGSPISVIV